MSPAGTRGGGGRECWQFPRGGGVEGGGGALARILGQPLCAPHDPRGVFAFRREVTAHVGPEPAHEVRTGRRPGPSGQRGAGSSRPVRTDREVAAGERRQDPAAAALAQYELAVEELTFLRASAGSGRRDTDLAVRSFHDSPVWDLPGARERHNGGVPGRRTRTRPATGAMLALWASTGAGIVVGPLTPPLGVPPIGGSLGVRFSDRGIVVGELVGRASGARAAGGGHDQRGQCPCPPGRRLRSFFLRSILDAR